MIILESKDLPGYADVGTFIYAADTCELYVGNGERYELTLVAARKAPSRMPKNPYLRFLCFFFIELFSFFIIASNFRCLALGLYIPTAITDAMIVCQSVIITKLMIEDEKTRDWLAILGFSLGGACGSLLSIFVTKHLFGG